MVASANRDVPSATMTPHKDLLSSPRQGFCSKPRGRDSGKDQRESGEVCLVVGASVVVVTVETGNGFAEKALPRKAFFAEGGGLGTSNFTLVLLLRLILLTPCCCCKHHEKCEDVSLHGGHERKGEPPWCTVPSYAAQDLSAEVGTASIVR